MMITRLRQTSPAMRIPMQVIYACIPISCALMVVRYAEHIVKLVRPAPAEAEQREG